MDANTSSTTSSDAMSDNAKLENVTTNTAAGPKLTASGSSPLSSKADSSAAPAQQTVARFSKTAHGALDSLSDALSRGIDASSEALETSKTFVKDKPIVAVGIALAVGMLVGRLNSNSRTREFRYQTDDTNYL